MMNMNASYGEVFEGLSVDGREVRSGVFNEKEVRVAAGITMAMGAIAFAFANYDHVFWPIKIVTTFFFIEFLIRVTVGFQYSPAGIAARWLMQREEPQWVSAKPKRFAWVLGMIMGGSMMIITNLDIHGALPRTICLICLALMWLEAVVGICVGCESHRLLVRLGLAKKDEDYEICSHGECAVPARAR